jgi:hypothetical protein
MNIIMYDFEVFSKANWWCVVIIDYNTREKTIIINDSNKLKSFYDIHKNDIWVGYNSRHYDQWIFKGILLDKDPFEINDEIILNDKKGYQIIRNANQIQLNNFDIFTGFHGLKQLEAFMGSTIKESDVSFDLDRKLNESEEEEVVKYCIHDVEQTIEVFDNRKEEFDSQLSLIKAFDLDMNMFNKTKAQLSAYILGSKRVEGRRDEFNISIPDTLNISEKYQYIVDWYKDDRNKDYKQKLYTTVSDVPHIFAWGGLHGAIDNHVDEGIILCCDVASLYPSIMIEYGYLSRNVSNPKLYTEIRDTRLELKKNKDPRQAPYKIVLNSTYGAMKDSNNDLYDPLMANNVCIAGQLLLLDLIDKIEPYCKLIQSNTDGLFLKVENIEIVEKIKEIAKEWEIRTRLDLEWDIYTKIYQKDVNNYIIIDSEGGYKSKGAYVKKLNNIDYDLPIVNKALVNYFVKNKPIEETINECNDLREFQKVVKVSRLYKYAMYGEEKIKEKVLRIFASNEENASGVFKVKTEERIEKIANTPDKCFIYNENVNGVKVPSSLDKIYYIEIAKKRLYDFINSKSSKKSNVIPSDIKFISQELKDKILELLNTDYDNFIEFMVYLIEDVNINSRQIEILIKLNYFKKYGRNKKLFEVFEEFKKKYNKNHKDKTKKERLVYLYEYEKNIEDLSYTVIEQMNFDIEYMGKLSSTFNLPRGSSYIIDLDTKNSPKAKVYGLSTGVHAEIKVLKKLYNKQPFQKGDLVQFNKLRKKQAVKYVGTNSKGKPVFEPREGEFDIWADEYKIIKLSI